MPKPENVPAPVKLVAVDDDPQNLTMLRSVLQKAGLEILTREDPEEGLKLVLEVRPEIVMVDLMMPRLDGMEFLDRVVRGGLDAAVLLMTGNYTQEAAVEAIERGAADFLEKPLDILSLQERIGRLVEDAVHRGEQRRLEESLLQASRFEGMVGRSPAIQEVFSRVRRVAPHFRTVLITGATGTGKELVARALHRQSPVSSGPFAVCNCSAIVETLFESELFGHMKGSFTGATQDKVGLFEYAHGGTVFLDEIGEMPLVTQAKILRVLQNSEIQRVGSPAVRKVDVRVVAATNRDLRALASEKQFREDLFYRLSAVEIKVPRLAERLEDLPLLIQHFLQKFSAEFQKPTRGLTARAESLLLRYPWPGNVRELESAVMTACMMAEKDRIDAGDLPDFVQQYAGRPVAMGEDDLVPLEEMQRRYILRVLERLGGNKMKAAEVLGIGRTTLYRVLNEPTNDPPE